jgi:hypothetical protein
MRFNQFKPRTLTEADLQRLDELRMSPSSLRNFGASDSAKGIMAGFEAELVFTGLGGESDYEELEPDMDADERVSSIQQVMEFFENDDWGYGISGRQASRLQDSLDEMYIEWLDGQMYDAWRDERDDLIKEAWLREKPMTERIHDMLVDGMDMDDREADRIQAVGEAAPRFTKSSEQEAYKQANPDYATYLEAEEGAEEILQEEVESTLEKEDGFYDEVLDDFRNDFYVDDDSGFFSDVGLRWMSDVQDQFDLMWPVMTGSGGNEGGFSEDNASDLAKSLSDELGVKTKVSSGYHSAKRDDVTWIFEPDSSLDADDPDNMPVEIVSPPMPLEECLRQIENFFAWAESNGAYANSSTGFHMGVSLPHRGGDVDYVKLALFLGDEYVLKEFGRSSNTYAEAAIKKIRSRVKGNKEAVASALELMKHNLLELAQKALEIHNHGFGKYTSINPQGATTSADPSRRRGAKYIEFRSAGGSNYFEDIDKLKNTLLRYAQAMTIAADPGAERKEYYKKLYKLISPPEGDPALDLFSRFATGEISSTELKKSWADKQLEAEPKGNWKLWNATNGLAVPGHEYNGYTKSEAIEKAKQKLQPGSSMEDFQKAYKLRPMQSETGDWEVYDVKTGETLETLRGYETRGAAADAVYDKYNKQGVAFNLRPADPEAPEKPLSQREKLAKSIVSKPAGPQVYTYYKWNVTNPKNGENSTDYMTRERVFQTTKQVEKENPRAGKYINTIVGGGSAQLTTSSHPRDIDDMTFDFRAKGSNEVIERQTYNPENAEKWQARPVVAAIERANALSEELGKPVVAYEVEAKADDSNDVANVKRKWEFYYSGTGRVLDTVDDINQMQANAVLADVKRRYDDLPADQIRMRSVPTAASRERYNDRQELNPVIDQPPAGMLTQRPATGDYYEVKAGERVYGYLPTGASSSDVARASRLYVNQLTGRDDAFVQYRSGDPVQATDATGEPIWQIYERESGHVIEEILASDQADAWSEAQEYLEGIGAENPSLFSVRPKMEQNFDNASGTANVQDRSPQDATDVPRNWEFVNRINGQVIHSMTNASYNQANVVQDNLELRYPDADIFLRSVERPNQ